MLLACDAALLELVLDCCEETVEELWALLVTLDVLLKELDREFWLLLIEDVLEEREELEGIEELIELVEEMALLTLEALLRLLL